MLRAECLQFLHTYQYFKNQIYLLTLKKDDEQNKFNYRQLTD